MLGVWEKEKEGIMNVSLKLFRVVLFVPSANEAEIRSGRWPALFISVRVCVFLSILTSVSDAQQRPAGSGSDERWQSWQTAQRLRKAFGIGASESPSGPHQTQVWVMRGHLLLMRHTFTFTGVSVCCLWHRHVSSPKPESLADTNNTFTNPSKSQQTPAN